MTEREEAKRIEAEINALIEKCISKRGYIYISDKQHNQFIQRIEAPVKIDAFVPSKKEELSC